MSPAPTSGWASFGLEVLRATDFDRNRLRRAGTYAVCFGATWCPPTQGFVPKFVRQPRTDGVTYAIGDITEMESPLWDDLSIEITPTLIVFRDGGEIARFPGRPGSGLGEADLSALARTLAGRPAPSAPRGAGSPP